jgi:hypothetical protein
MEISISTFGDEETPARSCHRSDGKNYRFFVGIMFRGNELYIGEIAKVPVCCTGKINTQKLQQTIHVEASLCNDR